MSRARIRAVPIVLAMIIGLLLLPLQGRAARGNEPTTGVQPQSACVDDAALSTSLSRPRVAGRRDAVEDADDAAPPHACVVAIAPSVGDVVLAAPTLRDSLVRADRPRARGPP
jgi:hypothetical protein